MNFKPRSQVEIGKPITEFNRVARLKSLNAQVRGRMMFMDAVIHQESWYRGWRVRMLAIQIEKLMVQIQETMLRPGIKPKRDR